MIPTSLRKRQFLSIDSAAAWMVNTKTKRTGQGLSPCFPPDVDGKVAFAVPTLVDISMFVYIFNITLTCGLSIHWYLPHYLTID
jgi:hypothetical protein